MNNKDQIIGYGLSLPYVYLDYPFDSLTATLRHKGNKKIFALIIRHNIKTLLNLKCEPVAGDFWRSEYESAIPAYHMNKKHWVSVIIGGDIPPDILRVMINDSYRLTRPKSKIEKRA